MIKYYCEICGKEFFSECGEGSYTDHVLNFVGNRKITVNRGSDDCINDIFYCGSHIRQENDIMDRLKCFCLWDNVDEKLRQKVSEAVKEMIKTAKEAEESAEKTVCGLTRLQRYYVKRILKRRCYDFDYIVPSENSKCGKGDD